MPTSVGFRIFVLLHLLCVIGGAEPPEIAELAALEKWIAAGWGVFNVIVLIVLYLMVFTPGR